MSRWISITETQARSHPKYGIKGLAAVFRTLLVLTPGLWLITSIVNLMDVIQTRGKLEMADSLLVIAPTVFFLWGGWNANALGKHDRRFFLSLYSVLALGPVLLIVPSLLWMMNSGLRHEMKDVATYYFSLCVAWGFWSAVIVAYVLLSRRINVTLRHRVRASDALISQV